MTFNKRLKLRANVSIGSQNHDKQLPARAFKNIGDFLNVPFNENSTERRLLRERLQSASCRRR